MIFLKRFKYNFGNATKLQQTKNNTPLISKLQSRSLIIVMGPDAQKLLQGIITNDIKQITQKAKPFPIMNSNQASVSLSNKLAMFTLFLNPKGRIITDAFIFRPKQYQNNKKQLSTNEFWIDVDKSMKNTLLSHLKKYTWKKDVDLIDVDSQKPDEEDSGIKPSIFVGFNHSASTCIEQHLGYDVDFKEPIRNQEYSNLMYYDPRGQNFGLRILCMQQNFGITKDFTHTSLANYSEYERALGYSNSQLTTDKLPFQFNFDFLNAISLKKGCYLGQQIVSRSYHTGIVRRRVFPFDLQKNEQNVQLQKNAILFDKDKKQIGKVIDYSPQKGGLVLTNYLQYFKNDEETAFELQISEPYKGRLYCPFGDKLHVYMNQMNSKQKKLQQLDI